MIVVRQNANKIVCKRLWNVGTKCKSFDCLHYLTFRVFCIYYRTARGKLLLNLPLALWIIINDLLKREVVAQVLLKPFQVFRYGRILHDIA